MNYQKVILSGNATADAKLYAGEGAVSTAKFSIGVSDRRKEERTYFPIVVFGRQAEALAKYIVKGRGLLVEGRVEVAESGRFNVVAERIVLGYSNEKPEQETTQ